MKADVEQLMRRVRRPGWRWDPSFHGLQDESLGLLIQPSDLLKFELLEAWDLQIALLGIETGATPQWHGAPTGIAQSATG